MNEDNPIGALVRAHARNQVPIQWRHLPAPASPATPTGGRPLRRAEVRLRGANAGHERDRAEKKRRMRAEPLLPGVPRDWLPNFTGVLAWSPPETAVLHRWVHPRTGERVVTSDGVAPEGFRFDFWLGAANRFPRPGTTPLVAIGSGAPKDFRAGSPPEGEHEVLLGHLELSGLPMWDGLFLAEHRETGQRVLVAGTGDPLAEEVDAIERLGLIEGYPSLPREAPGERQGIFGSVGLVRAVDHDRRRHVYGAGALPEGDLAGELGAMHDLPEPDSIPVWILADGMVVAGDRVPAAGRASLRATARWAVAPASWEGVATPAARARATARRTLSSFRHLAAPHGRPSPNGSLPSSTRPSDPSPCSTVSCSRFTRPSTRSRATSSCPPSRTRAATSATSTRSFSAGCSPRRP